jgi:hypothetical protein
MKKPLTFALPALLLAISLVFSACPQPDGDDPDTTPPAEVTGLSAVAGHQQVTLSWTAPADSDFARVEITHNQSGGGTAKTVNKGTNSYTWTSLTNGTAYTFTVKTVDSTGNKSAGTTKAATPANYSPSGGIVPGDLQAAIEAAATAQGKGGDADNPVVITIGGSGSGTAATDIGKLYEAIASAGKFVSLDLSGMTGITEWSYVDNDLATDKIVNITLPDKVETLVAGNPNTGALNSNAGGFDNLRTVIGAGVTDVGARAFYYCKTLTSVSLPKAERIGSEAFTECDALTSLSLPEATDILNYAFTNCDALASMNLPKAESIGDMAFNGTKYRNNRIAACKIELGGSIVTWNDTTCTQLYTAYETNAAGWYYRTEGSSAWNYKSTEPTNSDMGI